MSKEARTQAFLALYQDQQHPLHRSKQTKSLGKRAQRLVEGVKQYQGQIDWLISEHSHNWPVERMTDVDRSLLRLGVYELLNIPDTPTGVIISEVLKLANQYGSERSARFVHGVLSALARQIRKSEPPQTDEQKTPS